MIKIHSVLIVASLVLLSGCKNTDDSNNMKSDEIKVSEAVEVDYREKASDFVPQGHQVFEQIDGDLNKDGTNDCILIIKGTDKAKFVTDETRGELDRNRRGIIILFKQRQGYELATENRECFSSENEDGGVYFPPELDVYAKKGNLYIHYAHGRYGYTTYTFRYKKNDFDLIGYDSSDAMGPITMTKSSINFVTKKKQFSVNINRDDPDADEVFEDTWTTISQNETIRLSEIKDFDALDFSDL